MMSLDDDIAAWAATVRLPDAEAAALFQRIVATAAPPLAVAPPPGPSWWRDFTAGFAARMVSSTRPVRQAA
ncbi:MAG TPA: hypothetical protein VMG38_14205 [Trebonia sp.]|nr:hypothetical protein [Trebonia sp.]